MSPPNKSVGLIFLMNNGVSKRIAVVGSEYSGNKNQDNVEKIEIFRLVYFYE
jgi:hypothetical protein